MTEMEKEEASLTISCSQGCEIRHVIEVAMRKLTLERSKVDFATRKAGEKMEARRE